jgi:hypothetical protein
LQNKLFGDVVSAGERRFEFALKIAVSYHHPDAPSSEKDRAWQLFSIFIGDVGFQLDEANPRLSKEVHMLNIDPTELIGSFVESMRVLALDRKRVL